MSIMLNNVSKVSEVAECTDIGRIRALASRCYMDAYKEIHTEEQNRFSFEEMYSEESLRHQIQEQGSQFLIVSDTSGDLGYVAIYPLGEHRWMLDKLYVLPEYKGKGFGSILLEEAVRIISKEERGVFFLQLKVNRRNDAVAFYQHQGFRITGQWDVEIAGGKWVMDGYDMERSYNREAQAVDAGLIEKEIKQ